ncbi:small s [Fusarium agapanthi]|uniref:Small s n=1 Tax=Fusarium agapanthi TaxID=1803897 RepID=A0A9P5BAB8_9HYPO|nr:small s [Fusarium agapanthi]
MATGLEALGAASAVVQLRAFAGSLVSLSFKIYDGIPMPETELEKYSTKMMEAALRVQARGNQVPLGTQGTKVGNKLSEVSQECIDTASKLVEQLVSIEAQATRDAINTHVTSEFKALGIKNISDNQRQRLLKSLKPEEIRERYNAVLPSSDACFERVFASFGRVCRNDPGYKAWKGYEQAFDDDSENEMSQEELEYGDWIDDVDEIDHLWECFSTWLQSDDKLFWIRGKPGSGKSTLIKFLINNDNTKRLLGSWHPNTRILSHFFWKIGNEPQNSIRGLLCSLLYDLLSEDDDATEKVLRQFKFSESKDFYKEWSSQEAEKVLWYLLDASAQPTCIFVDGLDEISDKDGYQTLLSVVQRLTTCRGTKVCVSSRPETELVRRFEIIGVQNLRLDDLTKPEMIVYLQKEFEKLPKEQSAHLPLEEFAKTLLGKAQGVFLWLALASQSVTSGILNGDDKETLSQRLEELPEKLESLYQTMWERLNGHNQIYRETAARYFRFVIADSWLTGLRIRDEPFNFLLEPNLVHLSLAAKAEDQSIFRPKANEMELSELNTPCAATESDIQTRCAGMLQVGRYSALEGGFPNAILHLTRPVQFIHRTAHDFLADTEYGQLILNYRPNDTTLVDEGLKLLICRLNLANTYYHEFEAVSDCIDTFGDLGGLDDKGANPEAILAILRTIKDLYEDGALIVTAWSWQVPSFPCAAAYYLASFDDFIVHSFMPTPSPELATNSLQELALASRDMKMSKT